MAHPVICIYCKQKFDRDKEPAVQVSDRRYAHKKCADKMQVEKSQADKDYEALVNYVEKLFGVDYVSAKVAKQIKDFRETYGYTYSGMLGTLVYWYEERKATIDKANNGIGIIPYIYDQAKEYYEKIKQADAANRNLTNYRPRVIEITINPPEREPTKVKLFNLEEEEN